MVSGAKRLDKFGAEHAVRKVKHFLGEKFRKSEFFSLHVRPKSDMFIRKSVGGYHMRKFAVAAPMPSPITSRTLD
jgi:hypothetical protein